MTGLPIQVRDTGLAIKEDIPRSDVNKEYYTQNMEREVFFILLHFQKCLFQAFAWQVQLLVDLWYYRVLNRNMHGAANSISENGP